MHQSIAILAINNRKTCFITISTDGLSSLMISYEINIYIYIWAAYILFSVYGYFRLLVVLFDSYSFTSIFCRKLYTCIYKNDTFTLSWLRYDNRSVCICSVSEAQCGNKRKRHVRINSCLKSQIVSVALNIMVSSWEHSLWCYSMMTSSNGNIFRVTGPLCGEFTGPRWIPSQRPVTRSFDVSFHLCLNKRLSKQSWGWWFETTSRSLWRHCNALRIYRSAFAGCPRAQNPTEWEQVQTTSGWLIPIDKTISSTWA